jgi:hypothetical protein
MKTLRKTVATFVNKSTIASTPSFLPMHEISRLEVLALLVAWIHLLLLNMSYRNALSCLSTVEATF